MKRVAAAEKLQTRTEPDEWLYLGRLGWLIYGLAVFANLYSIYQGPEGISTVVVYSPFILVGAYLIVLFWKLVLRFVDNI